MSTRFVQLTAIVIAISAMLLLGWVLYLFKEEDYYPEPKSLAFYLKLSSLVRNMPLAYAASEPAYRGSVGDGPKPAQSSVCYAAQGSQDIWIVTNIRTYLQKRGYALDSSETNAHVALFAESKPIHYTAYVNEEGQSVDLVINASPKPQEVNVCITHYE